MATTESKIPSDGPPDPSGSRYDGFISYSHAADDLLAPRLQAGLQRFAKPWWKRRALRIFRDESSLSANPHLWSSIVEALDFSDWFVLLLSPEAAKSAWVNQEIEYWATHKDPARILPVVTDGEFGWTNGEVTGSSVPAALRGVFAEEPRWVDLRLAKGDDQLDLKDPRFADAVADIASAIRRIAKEELASEEVRQHRRTVRTAWAAGVALAAVTVAAVGFGIQSANNAAIARSREFAAFAVSQLDEDPELSMMLAIESVRSLPDGGQSPAAVAALRQALLDNNLLRRIAVDKGGNFSAMSGDGSTIYLSSQTNRTLSAIDIGSGSARWEYHDPSTNDAFVQVDLSPDGELVALAIQDFVAVDDPSVETDLEGNDAFPARILVFDARDGSIVEHIEPKGSCPLVSSGRHQGFTPDGRFFTFFSGNAACLGGNPDDDWIEVYDTKQWKRVTRLRVEEMLSESAMFSRDMSRVLISGDGAEAELRTFPELDLVRTYDDTGEHGSTTTALSPDGQRVVTWAGGLILDLRPLLVEAETGARIAFLDAVDDFPSTEALSFSPDGSLIAVTTRSGAMVFDAHTGNLVSDLGGRDGVLSHSFSDDSSVIQTSTEFDLLVWDLSGGTADLGAPLSPEQAEPFWVNPNAVVAGPSPAVWTLAPDLDNTMPHISVVDPRTGEVTAEKFGLGIQLPDGTFLINPVVHNAQETEHVWDPLSIWDSESGRLTPISDCSAPNEVLDFATPYRCDDGDRFFAFHFDSTALPYAVAPDGSWFAASAYTGDGEAQLIRAWDAETLDVRSEFNAEKYLMGAGESWVVLLDDAQNLAVFDIESGEEIASFIDEVPFGRVLEVASDSRMIYLAAGFGTLRVIDTATWQIIAEWEAHQGLLRGIALSDDESRLVTTAEDDKVKVWDLTEVANLQSGQPPRLLDTIPAPTPSDALWIDDKSLFVVLRDGARWLKVSLVVDDIVSEAEGRLTRGFTLSECATFQIEDCPTSLEEMRNQ